MGEANGISREVNRTFLKAFIKYVSTIMYKKWVIDPAKNMKMSDHEKSFRLTGFDICTGSNNATDIGILNYAAWASIFPKGFRLNLLSRTYNTTVTYAHQILGITMVHPAT